MKDLEFRKEIMSNEFTKQHIIGLPFPLVLHHFTAPDKGDYHDHPFTFRSMVLEGYYVEEIWYRMTFGEWTMERRTRTEGDSFIINPNHIHKIIKVSEGGCYTNIKPLEKVQEPGFWKFENGKAYRRQWNETEFKLYEI